MNKIVVMPWKIAGKNVIVLGSLINKKVIFINDLKKNANAKNKKDILKYLMP
jgi:hypothetical protein